jgi:hypothetical protein
MNNPIEVMALVKKISDALDGSEMKDAVTALAMCVAFSLDGASCDEERKSMRKYIDDVINKTLKQAVSAKGAWGKYMSLVMAA